MKKAKNDDFFSQLDMGVVDELLHKAVLQSFNAFVITDATPSPEGPLIVYVNQAFCDQTGYGPDELIGRSPKILQGPLTSQSVLNHLRYCLKNNKFFQGNTVNYRKDGSSYHVEWNISPIRNPQGEVSHYFSIQHDISDKVARHESERILAAALNATGDAVCLTDSNGRFLFINKAFEKLTGYSLEQLIGKTPKILNSGHHNSDFYDQLYGSLHENQPFHARFKNKKKNGDEYYCQQSISPVISDDGHITNFVVVSRDITAEVIEENQKDKELITDPLTGILNRRGGEQELQKSYDNFKKHGVLYSIILVDIDHFKRVNDQFGHDIGDEVIQLVAACLKRCARDYDFIARWGGEEFLLIANKCDLEKVRRLAERIRSELSKASFPNALKVTISQGIAQPDEKVTIKELIKIADERLYDAKLGGRDCIRG